MDDPRRYLGLHTVTMLRDLIRKWWQVDIGFADASGRPLAGTWPSPGATGGPAPGNDFCRAVLAEPEGQRRCLASLREIHRRLRRDVRGRGPVAHSCHVGLQMAASPVLSRDRYGGFVFACGFSSRELSRTRITRLRGTIGDITAAKVVLPGERVPVLTREDVERMKDLLAYGASEMAAFEEELSRREVLEDGQGKVELEDIVDRSRAMNDMTTRLRQMAPQNCPVLLTGEPGTGKRVIARALHLGSPRQRAPFAEFEGSTDPQAAEDRLFGQVRSGALGKAGLIESARGGTLYLRAGSWQPASIQVKLLRLMQEATLVPLGADRPVEVDVRLVLGLEGDLDTEVGAGRLRRDLATWLTPFQVAVPPLRQRQEDLAPLARLFVRRHTSAAETPPMLHADTLALLQRHTWPGNASELEEEIRSLLSLGRGDGLLLPDGVSASIRESAGYGPVGLQRAIQKARNLKQAIEILERELIREGLVRTGFNKSALARQLGISRSNLLAKVERYGLNKLRPPDD